MKSAGQHNVLRHLGTLTSGWAPLLDTTDVDQATELLRPAFFPVDITPSGKDGLRIRVKADRLPLLSIGYLGMSDEAMMRVADLPSHQIAVAIAGHTVTTWPGRLGTTVTGPGSATVFAPGGDVELAWSRGCAQLGIKISPTQIMRELELLLDRPLRRPVQFARSLDLTTNTSRSWVSLLGILAHEAGRNDGPLRHRLALANLQHLLIEGLLLTQPHSYADALSEDGRPAPEAVVKRAIDLMHGQPEMVWTTTELARATGVSARALQKAFARSGEPPPMTYLRHLRLRRARVELADASRSPASAAVTAVAGRWGFVHLGRFAQQYRELFGEAPSETLRLSND
ncbi:AraC family transcriptional regulator [Mycobacterium sp. M23085]|uniref:AraC family transcriptional regulator n=1 Tax=Mycobacterium sp. M23085 TaxID=3378087 RepID=UPI0038779B01